MMEDLLMSNATETTDATFAADVLQNPSPVLVDFWAEWCAPCRALAPMLDQVAEELAGKLAVYKVDVDSNQGTAGRYGIQSIPTLIIFQAGEPKAQIIGRPRSKESLLDEIERAVGVRP
jgi:thioredoxin 1